MIQLTKHKPSYYPGEKKTKDQQWYFNVSSDEPLWDMAVLMEKEGWYVIHPTIHKPGMCIVTTGAPYKGPKYFSTTDIPKITKHA